eukprot:m.404176 g.404176  ORF g.404176 m.404176 type:complete len:372 (+) comp16790_c3_seq9:74-1189(+)
MVTTVRYILATAAAVTLPIGATSGTPAPAPPCKTDFDCSLNGHCESSGVCSCRLPWKDSTRGAVVEPCSVLDVQPHPNDYIPAYGGGLARKSTAWMEQNPSSWGGNMIFDRVDGKYHLYVSEMAGGKGLSSWHTASEIVHAVASDPLDQFVKQDTVLKPWAHNAAPILSPNGCARHMSCRPRGHALSVSMTRSRSDGVRDMVQARMCSSARVCFAGRTSCFTLGLEMCTPRWLDQTDRGGRWRSTLTATTPPRRSTQTGLPLSCATTREAMSCTARVTCGAGHGAWCPTSMSQWPGAVGGSNRTSEPKTRTSTLTATATSTSWATGWTSETGTLPIRIRQCQSWCLGTPSRQTVSPGGLTWLSNRLTPNHV